MKKDRIILTGFMGTGKTEVGKQLATRLDFQFLDTDEMVEKDSGKQITAIFEKEGEAFFRQQEKKMVKKALDKEKVVVSTGGGAVMDPENLSLFKEKGVLIALSAPPELVLQRVQKMQNRPLLKQKDQLEAIKNLLSHRSPYYRQADTIIDTSEKSIDDVIKEILKFLDAKDSR